MEQKSVFKSIPVGQAKTILEQEKNILVLDVRTKEEYELWHVETAINISHTEIDEGINTLNPPKNQTILILCKSGGRSSYVSELLADRGYLEVYNVEGGYIAWNRLLFTRKEITKEEFDQHRRELL